MQGEIMELQIGQHSEGWCARCKLVQRHTIESVASGKIKRSRCDACGGRHLHRKNPPRGRGAVDASRMHVGTYAALLRGRTAASARPYSQSARFSVGDAVSHSTLGLGVVTAERERTKIDILFPDGQKVLLQGRC